MRPTFTVELGDSLELAARKLREVGTGLLPVTQDGFLAGVVTEEALAAALGEGRQASDSVEAAIRPVLTAHPSTTGAEALRLFGNQGSSGLVVIDGAGRVLGVLTPSDLYPKRLVPPRPPLVGGMATPFGVYLTTGSLRAGVGHFALITTGMTLFSLLLVGNVLAIVLSEWSGLRGFSPVARDTMLSIVPYALLLGGMRLIPLSGIHAAEHKVVHAIERGEELLPSIVRRMPRVHPRCGTNLVTGASLFMGIDNSALIANEQVRFLLAALVTLFFWRPLGSAMQYWVTTKKPTDKHIAMGIKSGRELLEKYATSGSAGASIPQRILNSGILHVLTGSLIMFGVCASLAYAFHLTRYIIGP